MDYFWIFFGGGLGACLRGAVSRSFISSQIPMGWSTLLVNILGTLLIFKMISIASPSRPWLQPFFVVGFAGGLTTFSTFSLETYKYFNTGNWKMALALIFLNVLSGIGIGFLIFTKKWL